jgi:hypothetical protein
MVGVDGVVGLGSRSEVSLVSFLVSVGFGDFDALWCILIR